MAPKLRCLEYSVLGSAQNVKNVVNHINEIYKHR